MENSSREKQIEEMANVYYEAMLKATETLGSMNKGAPKWYAKELYNSGYRKASEVAREIFEEIENLFNKRITYYSNLKNQSKFNEKKYAENMITNLHIYLREIAELKKKYTEEK